VIFATSTPLTVAIPGIVAKVRHRRPLVFEVRDLWPEIPIEMGYLGAGLPGRLARRLAKVAYIQSSEIVALSPGMVEGIQRVIGTARAVTLIPNAADTRDFDPGISRPVPDWWPARRGDFAAVYTGTFGPANDINWVASVAACLARRPDHPAVHFVLLGDGRDRNRLVARIDELGVRGSVHVIDPVPKEEMPSVLAAATVCLCLFAPFKTLETTSPNKLFDGLAAGRPVLVNYGGWQEELLERHEAGLRLSRNPDEAADQLVALASDPALLEKMGGNARRLAVSSFDRDLLYASFREVLERAVESGTSRARSGSSC
jgi:glycosyltransferase involved in cell wall biosynthesis